MSDADKISSFPTEWWESRTTSQLQDLSRAGLAAGDHYDGALRELDRRARELTRMDEQAAALGARDRSKATRRGMIAASLAFAAVLGVIVALVFG